MRIKRNNAIAACAALAIGCAVVAVVMQPGSVDGPVGGGTTANEAEEFATAALDDQAGPAADVVHDSHERSTPTDRGSQAAALDTRASGDVGGGGIVAADGGEAAPETDGEHFLPPVVLRPSTNVGVVRSGVPPRFGPGTYIPDRDAPPVEQVPAPGWRDWLPDYGVWMPIGDNWVQGFVSSDAEFFATEHQLDRNHPAPPPADAPTISYVGEDRVFYVSTHTHFVLINGGEYFLPGLSVGYNWGAVSRFLKFAEQGQLLARGIRIPSFGGAAAFLENVCFELTDDIEVITITKP